MKGKSSGIAYGIAGGGMKSNAAVNKPTSGGGGPKGKVSTGRGMVRSAGTKEKVRGGC